MGKNKLEDIFNARSVAIVGAKNSPASGGGIFLDNLLNFGYEGDLYPVTPRGGTVKGLKAYKSVRDIPGPVDLVIVASPSQSVPKVLDDCAVKGVKCVSLFTAGFAETGIADRVGLQQKIATLASKNGMRILGPNCMGIYCPGNRLTFTPDFPAQSGPVGAISQSGGNSLHLVREAALRGVRFSKVISYGNAADLNEADLLEYLAEDDDTEIIACYIEGTRNGTRLKAALERAAARKPVLVLKGGISDPGTRAVMGHTGSLTTSAEVWSALFRQTGVEQVRSVDELVDILLPHVFMKKPEGRRTLLLGSGGGATVQAADACARAGLKLPPLPDEIIGKLREFLPPQGNIIGNPTDLSWGESQEPLSRALQIMAAWDQIDFILLHVPVNLSPRSMDGATRSKPTVRGFIEGAKASGKPVAAAVHSAFSSADYNLALDIMKQFWQDGIPVFKSVESAAFSIDRFLRRDGK